MKHILLIITMIIVFTGCGGPEPVDNYKDSIVKEVYTRGEGPFKSYYYTVQSKSTSLQGRLVNTFNVIKVVHSDYIRYNVGDTIK